MFLVEDDDPIVTRIVIRRNQSLERAGWRWIMVLVGAPTFAVVALALWGGWWPILGFCLAVFAVFALVLHLVMAGGREREVVTVSARRVVVESGRSQPRMRVTLDRYWSRVERHTGARPALRLISRGVVVEIGAALGEADQKSLAKRLAALIGADAPPADLSRGAQASETVQAARTKQ